MEIKCGVRKKSVPNRKDSGISPDIRSPEGYFAMMRDFILNGRIGEGSYGSSTIYRSAK
jgi:hypothetical protein